MSFSDDWTLAHNSHEKVDARYRRRAIWLFARIFGKFLTTELLLVETYCETSGATCIIFNYFNIDVTVLCIPPVRRTVISAWTSVPPFSRLDRTPNAGDLTAKVTDPRIPVVGSGILHCCLSLAYLIINCKFWRTLIYNIITHSYVSKLIYIYIYSI